MSEHSPTDNHSLADEHSSEGLIPTIPETLHPDLLLQAMQECRIPSDITMSFFGHLPRIAEVYNGLARERQERIDAHSLTVTTTTGEEATIETP